MKNNKKKIFKTILLIAIILLAVGCGMASCKKTHAYDKIEPLNQNESRDWLLLLAGNVGIDSVAGTSTPTGQQMNVSTGSTLEEQNITVSNDYYFYDFVSAYDQRSIFLINMYRVANSTNCNVQYIVFEEDVVQAIYTDSLTIDQLILVFFNPGDDGFDSSNVVISKIITNSTQNYFSMQHISDRSIPMLDEIYTDGNDTHLFQLVRGSAYNMLMGGSGFHLESLGVGETFINFFNNYRLDSFVTPGLNTLIARGYAGGYDNGYSEGFSAGGSASTETAYQNGYSQGYSVGLNRGEQIGYGRGYDAGQSGDNAVSSFINILTSIFTGIGAIFSIQLFPHVTIGVFFLVPLFFGVLGLILWIWRHN